VLTRKPRKGDVVRSPEVEGVVFRVEGDLCHIELTKNERTEHLRRVPGMTHFGLGETSFIWRFVEGFNENFTIVEEMS
jgi:hypothetical protein